MYALLLLFALAILSPQTSYAANIFEPVQGSIALKVLNGLFGKIDGAGIDAFNLVMLHWNGAIMTVAGVIAGYTILTTTIGTAHDGEMLGKKFSSAYLPIRYCLGTAVILPVIKGYCAVQFVVYWLVVQGIGLADTVWSTYVSDENITQSVSAGITRPEASGFTYRTLETLTCQTFLTEFYKNNKAVTQYLDGGSEFGMSVTQNLTSTTYSFGDTKELGGFRKDTCGSITIKNWSMPENETSSTPVNFLFKTAEATARMKSINQEHHNQVAVLLQKLQPYAYKLSQGQPIDMKEVNNLADEYEEAVRLKAGDETKKTDTFAQLSENASRDGFFSAGAFYMPLSNMADMVQRSVADVPIATGPRNLEAVMVRDEWTKVQQNLKVVLATVDQTITTSTTFGLNSATGQDKGWWDTMKDVVLSGFDVSKLVDKAFSSTTNFFLLDGENPLMAMKRMGNWLLGIAGTAWVTLNGVLVTAGNAPGIGSAVSLAIVMFISPLVVAGFLLSYVYPFAVFLIWIGALTAWILMVLEAVIAAPLWAVMHLTPGGDDMLGSGASGYRLVLSLLLRPALMVFGLIAGLEITQLMGNVLNMMFAGVFLTSQAGSGVIIKIFGCLIAAPVLYGAMMYTFTKKMFEAITHLPDEMLNWIGGGGPQLGKFADDVGGDRSHVFVAAGAIGRGVGGSAESMRGKGGGEIGDKGDDRAANMAERNQLIKDEAQRMNSEQDENGINGLPNTGVAKSNDSGDDKTSFSEQSKAAQSKRIDEQFSNIGQTLGGEESESYNSFRTDLEKRMGEQPDKPVMDNINASFNRELNRTFGKGTGGNLKEISGGSYSGEKFKEMLSRYQGAQKALDNAGYDPKESKQLIEKANMKAKESYLRDKESAANGGKVGLDQYLGEQLKQIAPE